MLQVPYSKQASNYSCGAAALQMVFRFYGEVYSEKELAQSLGTRKDFGTSHQAMINLARSKGFRVYETNQASLMEIKSLINRSFPVIVNFIEPSSDEGHYAVVVAIRRGRIVLNDPWNGKGFTMKAEDFKKRWINGLKTSRRWLMAIRPKS